MSAPQLIVHNAKVYTMDAEQPTSSAFAVLHGRVLSVGEDAEILALASPETALLDAAGAAVIPGLMDAHNHHSMAGEEDLFRLKFSDAAGVAEICAAVEGWIRDRQLTPGEWVLGGNWGSTLLPELSAVEAISQLDAVSPHNPVVLTDDSHHNKWVNSAALAAAGIVADTPDPEGGTILRDAAGRPTGLMFEGAGALIERVYAACNAHDLERAARSSERAIEMMHELGITAFQDASGNLQLLQALKHLDDTERLHAWAVTSLLINDHIFGNEILGTELMAVSEEYRTEHHHPDFSKIFLDGIPPTRTAAFLEPYLPSEAHGHEHFGTTTMPLEELEYWLRTAHSYGLGVKVHCTGDASVRMVLDAVATLRAEEIGVPVHIAHGQYVHPDDVPRLAQLEVTAEISPPLWFPGIILEALRSVIPEPLASHVHPNRDLLDAGALVVGGSDWPVSESPNPWHAIYGLVTRKNPVDEGLETLWPGQAITVEEAIRAYTVSSAKAMRLEQTAGRLVPGLSADFVVLSTDPFTSEVESLKDITATETWFAGRRVFVRA